ncbi:MAG: pitrilysin family protein [bacterium]|nr:pitrilysin family protein [bacterium]
MFKTTKLNSGLEIISAPIKGTKTVTVLFMAATGSRFEDKKISGISHFLEHLFFKGTAKRPNTLIISSELDKAGGEYNAFTGKEYTGYYIKVAAGQLALALDVLSDMLLNSKFAAEEIEREKGVVVEELNMYLDNPLYYIEDLFEQCLYGDTPAGRDTIGGKQSIMGFSREKIIDYFSSQYSAPRAVICLAGRVNAASARLTKNYFKEFNEKKYRDKPKTDDRQAGPNVNLHFKKTDQAHLSLGARAYPYGHPDQAAAKLVSLILGGSMSSRLFTELRERNGLAYYVRTQDEAYTDSGYLTTQAGVPIDKLERAVKIILSQYKKITAEPVSAAELSKVKQCLIGRTTLQLESSDSVASWYARQAILLKEQSGRTAQEILTPEQYFARINQVKAEDIRRVAKKIFVSHKLNLAVIGPYQKRGELEQMLKL